MSEEKDFKQENGTGSYGESRDGYKSYGDNNNRYSRNRGGDTGNNRNERPYRQRVNNTERVWGGNNESRPNNNYGQDRSYSSRPRFNREGNNEERGYGNNRYNNSGGGFNNQRGGYNRPSGGYNNEGGSRGRSSFNNREGYNSNREGSSDNREGYNSSRESYNNNREGYKNNREGYNNREGGYQRPYRPNYRNDDEGNGGNRNGNFRPRYNSYGGDQQRGERFTSPRRPSGNYDPNAKYSAKKRLEYKEEHFDPNEPIRLNKYLANAGVCSRRDADKYIQAGVVTVNGEVVTELGTKVMRTDDVKFHDDAVRPEKKVYVLLNKPKDYVTTSDDPQKRKTVMDLVHDACRERIYPVGRLDRNTTGVLLLTNDGDLASKLTHPKFLKKKIYHVYTDKNVTLRDMQQIAEGITLEDGEIRADAIDYASDTDKKQVGIEIHSGKNRIVRRIFESLGYHVTKLDRVYFAGLTKKNLRRGDWRYLTEKEVNMLRMGAFE